MIYIIFIMDKIIGILSSKQEGIGTLSEGPSYWLEPLDDYRTRWDLIIVRKQTHLWEKDPKLHPFIGKKVEILGEIIETKSTITIDCSEIKEIE